MSTAAVITATPTSNPINTFFYNRHLRSLFIMSADSLLKCLESSDDEDGLPTGNEYFDQLNATQQKTLVQDTLKKYLEHQLEHTGSEQATFDALIKYSGWLVDIEIDADGNTPIACLYRGLWYLLLNDLLILNPNIKSSLPIPQRKHKQEWQTLLESFFSTFISSSPSLSLSSPYSPSDNNFTNHLSSLSHDITLHLLTYLSYSPLVWLNSTSP